MDIDARAYGLSPKIRLKELGDNHIGIVKLIKSRIIQQDAAKVVEVAKQIKAENSECKVSLICTRNIWSKSLALLGREGIDIVYEELQ
ncbi:MAG: hypothetical protein P4L28_11790 [Paludibacteraceae bacterium]|nr:hypothetical protein [Paludibacteraceae bacterium]